MTVENSSDRVIVIAQVESSCPCVTAIGLPIRIDPGGHDEITLKVDSTQEPEFRGGLAVEMAGLDEGGVARLHWVAHVEIVD